MVNLEFLRPRSHSHNSIPFPQNVLRPRAASLNDSSELEQKPPQKQSPNGSARKINSTSSKEKFEINELYDVKFVGRDSKANKIKVRYVGMSKNYDQWLSTAYQEMDQTGIVTRKPRFMPRSESFELRKGLFLDEVRLRIKDHLRGGTGSDDVVSIALTAEEDIYDLFKYHCTKVSNYLTAESYKDLEVFFGTNWYFRIYNEQGDFASVREETFKICFKKRASIQEYVYSRGTYTEKTHDVPPKVIFRFVRDSCDKTEFETNFMKNNDL